MNILVRCYLFEMIMVYLFGTKHEKANYQIGWVGKWTNSEDDNLKSYKEMRASFKRLLPCGHVLQVALGVMNIHLYWDLLWAKASLLITLSFCGQSMSVTYVLNYKRRSTLLHWHNHMIFTVLGKLGPGKLGPGQLGPGQLGPGQSGPKIFLLFFHEVCFCL